MTKDEFTRLYEYMVREFGLVHQKLDEKASQKDIDRILTILDHHTSEISDLKLELGALSAKIDRYHPA